MKVIIQFSSNRYWKKLGNMRAGSVACFNIKAVYIVVKEVGSLLLLISDKVSPLLCHRTSHQVNNTHTGKLLNLIMYFLVKRYVELKKGCEWEIGF